MTPYGPARREFLMRALTACSAPFLVQSVQAQGRQTRPTPGAKPQRGAQVAARYLGAGGRDSVEAIGEAYLKQLGIDRTEEAILAAAAGTLQLIARSPTETAAVTALVRAVRRDFREQRSVQLDGWILARTEVELCILALLSPGGG